MATQLFSKEDLEAYLQRSKQQLPPGIDPSTPIDDQALIDQRTYDVVHRVVNGWLLDATGLQDWPTPVPPQVFSWAVELGAIAHENPASASTDTTDRISVQWSETRRNSILNRAAEWARNLPAAAAVASPVGSFPPPAPLPRELSDSPGWARTYRDLR